MGRTSIHPWPAPVVDQECRVLVVTSMVRTPGQRDLAICEWGVDDGSPVFWLHGTPGSRYLRHVGDGYLRVGLRVITYDRPGYGRSTRAAGRSIADVAGDVVTIADSLGLDRFGVAGVSSGGPHALAVAALAPDRVTRCAAIVTLAPPDAVGLDWYTGMEDDDRTFWQRAAAEVEPFLHQDFQETAAWVASGMPELASESADDDYRMAVEAFTEAVSGGPAGNVDDFLACVQPWGFTVDDIEAPTQIMLARDDTSVPASHGDWYLKHLPAGRADHGHRRPLRTPRRTRNATDGLARQRDRLAHDPHHADT
jgi:pimeloyl-ACP methyl ester carboxylesterase